MPKKKAAKEIPNIKEMPIGSESSWKFGVITRDVYRVSQNKFEINDTSDGWTSVTVSLKTMQLLLSGKKDLLSLNWK